MIVFRFEEAFTYPNASVINDRIVDFAKAKTRRGRASMYTKLGDRPWNEGYVPRSMEQVLRMNENDNRPLLHAVVYDFGGVSSIDSTGLQALVDTRQQLDRYADHEVEYHFAQIRSRWIKRALVAGGFGVGHPNHPLIEVASVIPISHIGSPTSHDEDDVRQRKNLGIKDEERNVDIIEKHQDNSSNREGNVNGDSRVAPIVETVYPFFHLDLDDAVRSAEKGSLKK